MDKRKINKIIILIVTLPMWILPFLVCLYVKILIKLCQLYEKYENKFIKNLFKKRKNSLETHWTNVQ